MFHDDLIRDLREAYARHGKVEASDMGLCGIRVMTFEELRDDFHALEIAEVEFPPLEGYDKRRVHLAIWWNETMEELFARKRQLAKPPYYRPGGAPTVPPSSPTPPPPPPVTPYRKAADEFLSLARRLGACLPLDDRKALEDDARLHVPPDALWCLFLFRDHALRGEIVQSELEQMCDGRARPYARPWGEPFRASLELVQRLVANATLGIVIEEDVGSNRPAEIDAPAPTKRKLSGKAESRIKDAMRALPPHSTQKAVAKKANLDPRTVRDSETWKMRAVLWAGRSAPSGEGSEDTDDLIEAEAFVERNLEYLHHKTLKSVKRIMADPLSKDQLLAFLANTNASLERDGSSLAGLTEPQARATIRQAAEHVREGGSGES